MNGTTPPNSGFVGFLNCSTAFNGSGHITEEVARQAIDIEIAGTATGLVVEVLFIALVCLTKSTDACKSLYHWYSLDHVLSFAILTFVQACSYLISAPFNFESTQLPPSLCFIQAAIRSFTTFGILLECAVIPYLAFLVIVKKTSFPELKERYRTKTFLFVYGGATLFSLVPSLVQLFSGGSIVLYSASIESGTLGARCCVTVLPLLGVDVDRQPDNKTNCSLLRRAQEHATTTHHVSWLS